MTQFSLTARDLKHIWHPCSQMKDYADNMPLIPIKNAKGVWLYDYENNKYIDAVSSWWVNLFGHNNPTINEAIKNQVDNFAHIMLAGFSHEPAVLLAEKLAQITPEGLTRTFFAENGSCSVEIALKMSFQYWQNQGKTKKTKFLHLSNGYHGETIAALSVSDLGLYKDIFNPLLLKTLSVPSPDCSAREPGVSWEAHSTLMFEKAKNIITEHHEEIAAIILEPLVQCAGHMRMYHPIYLSLMKEVCQQYNIHFIADEIAVGFGRTGTLFACEQANISPDFLCLSKGITGGYLPLSVVMTHDNIYEAFYADYESMKGFMHSHSYTGNALGVSAANATLSIFENDNIIEKNKHLITCMRESALRFEHHQHISDIRQTGMILAVEMAQDKSTPYPWQARKGLEVYRYGLSKGVILRPLGNVIYFMPPYVITPDEIDYMMQVALEGINLATK